MANTLFVLYGLNFSAASGDTASMSGKTPNIEITTVADWDTNLVNHATTSELCRGIVKEITDWTLDKDNLKRTAGESKKDWRKFITTRCAELEPSTPPLDPAKKRAASVPALRPAQTTTGNGNAAPPLRPAPDASGPGDTEEEWEPVPIPLAWILPALVLMACCVLGGTLFLMSTFTAILPWWENTRSTPFWGGVGMTIGITTVISGFWYGVPRIIQTLRGEEIELAPRWFIRMRARLAREEIEAAATPPGAAPPLPPPPTP